MDSAAIALILGMLPLLFLPQLPSPLLLAGLAILALLLWRQVQQKWCQLLCWLLLGFVFAALSADALMQQMASLANRQDADVIVTVSSVRLEGADMPKVRLRIEQISGHRVFPAIFFTANWQGETLCAGQRLAMKVRFRPVHSSLNEGGFDGQRWAVANRQPLSGYIRSARIIDGHCGWRQRVIDRADKYISDLPHRDILLALAFGERALMSSETRELFIKTGIAHLMAISGLHISMSAVLIWGLVRLVQYPLPVRYIGYRLPLLIGWFAMLIYVWLAGAQPPALRTAIALSLWLVLRLRGVICSSWQILLWCICLILLSDPISVLSDSFWLSVLAVAALIFWFEWAPLPAYFNLFWFWAPVRWLHIQLGMTLLLLPLQFGLFNGVTWTSLPANLWAVPIISLLSVPLILLALMLSFIPVLSAILWWLADITVTWALWPLPWLEVGWLRIGAALMQFSAIGWLMVVCWRFHWWRSFPSGCLAVLLCGLLWRDRQQDYRWRVDIIDVGHGLAVLIERKGKAVIYDSGDLWGKTSAAERMILPYLHWRQVIVEQIIISHSHQDHSGGLAVLQAAFPQASVRSPLSDQDHLACTKGQRWRWNGLHFQVLWPPQQKKQAGNNDSCIVRVDDGKYSVLLTGDIEQRGEQELLKQRSALSATLLQVPHHGSNTSSSPPFLRAVAPKLAVASAARYNAWRLPAEKIVKRYRENNITWRDTAHSGQLSMLFFDNDWQIKGFREQLNPRWWYFSMKIEQ
ncbi:competence protein ComEC [Chania multitudinisentens RB-25]|uniref:Competence protein ComEC n=1 Tax=Chania multitudinisentens RB-25 TaxID=1441930 RepID=W0LHR4_9GAMM|nr:competence protein ComEC [Chania multitudinisentens RB-25]